MDTIIERLKFFVESKGGATIVGERINKHPNKFYVMFRGETKPNSDTILELKKAYPDLDLNWLYVGTNVSLSNDSEKSDTGILQYQSQIKSLQADKEALIRTIKILKE